MLGIKSETEQQKRTIKKLKGLGYEIMGYSISRMNKEETTPYYFGEIHQNGEPLLLCPISNSEAVEIYLKLTKDLKENQISYKEDSGRKESSIESLRIEIEKLEKLENELLEN